ncbi:MAG: efflux RND transporter periplasmic adaptor subunit [Deltaproteobacteria bacterium]|jgi:RND family efflux transporter MFP subunit|nr:efflux RND transporter periplasmic adaptor subunit [Deltaproteobacteria bacterium]
MQNQFCKPLVRTLLGLSLLLAISACREAPPPPPERIRAIKTITVSEQSSGKLRQFSGVVEAADSSSIGFEVSGNIREVRVDVGDRITKGQVLAVLDKRTYNLNVKAAEAELGRAEVQLADKRNDLDRFQRINKQDPGAVSQAALDQSQAAVDSARKQVQFTKSGLKLAQRDLDKTVLRAPFDGVIANRYIDAFNEVARGQKCFDVYENTGMEVAVSIPEDAIDDIRMDQKGEIRFSVFADRIYHGRVSEISKVAGTANAFPIKLAIEDPDQRIRPGMTARVTLLLAGGDEKAAYLVPLSAIAQRGDTTKGFVYIYDSQTSTVKKTQIEAGSVRGNSVVIYGGVKEGDIVAVAGVSFLEDGQKVKLMEQPAEKEDFEIKKAE